MRIACGGIQHETNTFATVPTTLEDFRRDSEGEEFLRGEVLKDVFRGSGTVMGGYVDAAEQQGVELEALLSARAQPAGPVTSEANDHLLGLLLERLEEVLPVDGVLLDLHGAMVTDDHEDAEGEIIAAVRRRVGADVPIVTTLDLHANITRRMADESDCLIGYDTYPHVDMRERGLEAVELLARMIAGEIRPVQEYRQLPLLTMPPMQCTLREPMKSLIDRLHGLEAEPAVLTATVSMGFPFADITDAGVSVLVTADGDRELAAKRADELAGWLWELRDRLQPELTSIEEAMRIAAEDVEGLVIFADGSDNPGGGAPCDGTVALEAMLAAGFAGGVVGVLYDPETVERAGQVGTGGEAEFTIGGKTDGFHGSPLSVTARVITLGDGRFTYGGPMRRGLPGNFGPMAVLESGGVEIVLASRRQQLLDAEMLRVVGISPETRRLLVAKSAVHFRADLGPLAVRIVDGDTPGIHRPDFANFDYHRVRRPIHPLDPGTTWPPA